MYLFLPFFWPFWATGLVFSPHIQAISGRSGPVLGHFWPIWACFGPLASGLILGLFGPVLCGLGPFCGDLCLIWAFFGSFLAYFILFRRGDLRPDFRPILDDFGPISWGFVPYLGLSWEVSGLIWPSLEGADFGDWGADIGDFGPIWPSFRGYPCLI